ncbi:hypothetical protein QJS66_17630 [Kocuria rhizophila]|nr:hypothetical protein QJS66_17630 [Kocuria rhizophila]
MEQATPAQATRGRLTQRSPLAARNPLVTTARRVDRHPFPGTATSARRTRRR